MSENERKGRYWAAPKEQSEKSYQIKIRARRWAAVKTLAATIGTLLTGALAGWFIIRYLKIFAFIVVVGIVATLAVAVAYGWWERFNPKREEDLDPR